MLRPARLSLASRNLCIIHASCSPWKQPLLSSPAIGEGDMHLEFAATQDLLSQVFSGVGENVIYARLKYFQREDFPSEAVSVGSGLRATFDIEDLWRLILAFELLDLSSPPAQAMAICRGRHWEVCKAGLREAWRRRESGGRDTQPLLVIRPRALGSNTFKGSVELSTATSLSEVFASKAPRGRGVAIIDLSRVARRVGKVMERSRTDGDALIRESDLWLKQAKP